MWGPERGMSKLYRFNETDKQVLLAVGNLLRRLIASGRLRPAQLVTIAKVQHVLSRLPSATDGVTATIEISWRISYDGSSGSSSWQFSVGREWLNLSCGGSEYTEGVGSDSFTTMDWSARAGERTDYDGRWDDRWMERYEGYSDPPAHSSDFSNCTISVDDDDNPLLFEPEEPEPGEEGANSETALELYRRGEKIDLTSDEWRAALGTFQDWCWEPETGLDRYSISPAFVKHDEGNAMQEAGQHLWRQIDRNAVLA